MSIRAFSRIGAGDSLTAVLVISGLAVAYRDVAPGLVSAWSYDPNYSHGYLIVPIAAYLAWERRQRFMDLPSRGSNWGLVVLLGSLLTLAAGVIGVELFLTRVSLLGTIAGIVLFFFGWNRLRVMAFPLAFLILMIPLPAIVFNQLTFPLQLIASQLGETLVRAAGIAVSRDGNVLVLDNITLQVAEACSGIRSLVSLLTLGIVFAYVSDTRWWARTLIVVSTVPTAIVSNGFRIAGTAVASHFYGAAAAEGFFHQFSGWLLFFLAFFILALLHRALLLLAPDARGTPIDVAVLAAPPRRPDDGRIIGERVGPLRGATVFTLLIVCSAAIGAGEQTERVPVRQTLATFPAGLGLWRGYADPPLDETAQAALNADDYLMRTYYAPDGTAAGLYIGYWETQRRGDAVHSPLNCLPGVGWQPLSKRRLTLRTDDFSPTRLPVEVNRYVVQKDAERLLVLYWYQSHGRVIASEYAGKLFLITDSMRMRRSDTAIVRVITPIAGSDGAAEARAERSAAAFVQQILPILDRYVPL